MRSPCKGPQAGSSMIQKPARKTLANGKPGNMIEIENHLVTPDQ